MATGSDRWSARASVAEQAVCARHLRALWWLPGTRLGVVAWPAKYRQRLFHGRWHYWWQAHLLDCLLDAQLRAPSMARRHLIERLIRGIRLRNAWQDTRTQVLRDTRTRALRDTRTRANLRNTGWTNAYYDDIAWLGLALRRAAAVAGVHRAGALREIISRLHAGWTSDGGGGIWWRVGSDLKGDLKGDLKDDFKNVPANGPAAILLARSGGAANLRRAIDVGDWITAELVDPDTGLVWDGLRVNADGRIRTKEKHVYTYCQGVYLGACLELAVVTGDDVWLGRAARTVTAVVEHLVDAGGVLRCHGGGDGGLFTGILARYLALAAVELPATEQATKRRAARLVLTSARAAWRHRSIAAGGPVFGMEWAGDRSASAAAPPNAPVDLSVQLSGWMLCEAAALVERRPALARVRL